MYLENNQVHRYPIRAVLSWMLVIFWMSLIFVSSQQSGSESGQLSRRIVEFVLDLTRITPSEELIATLDALLRNLAHGSVFFVLGILTSFAFTHVNVQDFRNALLSLGIGIFYAASDEWHQAFIPGRASQLSDFLIDAAGVILAVLVYQVISTLRFLRTDLRVKREEDLRI